MLGNGRLWVDGVEDTSQDFSTSNYNGVGNDGDGQDSPRKRKLQAERLTEGLRNFHLHLDDDYKYSN